MVEAKGNAMTMSRRSVILKSAEQEARAHIDICKEVRKAGVANSAITDEEIKAGFAKHGEQDVTKLITLILADKAQVK